MGPTPAQAQDHLAPVLITSEYAPPHQPLRRGPDRRVTFLQNVLNYLQTGALMERLWGPH